MNTLTHVADGAKAASYSHPAKYTEVLLPVMASMLAGRIAILDIFAGVGGIFALVPFLPLTRIEGIEIEPEWAAMHPRTTLGSALALPWKAHTFDAICTSPAYGNRLADALLLDKWKRFSYANALGRKLHPNNGGGMKWGPKYRAFHFDAYIEAYRVLMPGGIFVLNMKDHIRNGQRQFVTKWHVEALCSIGFVFQEERHIKTPSLRYGQNHEARIEYESVIKLSKEY